MARVTIVNLRSTLNRYHLAGYSAFRVNASNRGSLEINAHSSAGELETVLVCPVKGISLTQALRRMMNSAVAEINGSG